MSWQKPTEYINGKVLDREVADRLRLFGYARRKVRAAWRDWLAACRQLRDDIYEIEAEQERDLGWLCACLLASVFRHPYRALVIWLAAGLAGWLWGYDVR